MSKDTPTPRQRAEHVLATLPIDAPGAVVVDAVLSAALDTEELAREFYRLGLGHCYEGWASCPTCRQTCRDYAVAARDYALRAATP